MQRPLPVTSGAALCWLDLRRTGYPAARPVGRRFLQCRIAGLMEELHPGQQPSVRTPKLQAKVLAAIKEGPKHGSTHWSCRKLAARFHVSKDTIQRILAQADVRPHRLERYKARCLGAVIVGSSVILFDPISQGLAIALMAGEIASLLL
jgi:hypothetical protein